MLKATVLLTAMTINSPILEAKAPHCDGMEVTSEQSRIPAQNATGAVWPKLDDYLDMNCKQLTDESSQDGFIKFFRKELKSLNPDICSIVIDEASQSFEDEDGSQAEKKTIGLGTFSKLIEVHFNDYLYDFKLGHYQDLECDQLMAKNSRDSFVQYFSQKMEEEGINLCSGQDDFLMDDDRSQADRPIGKGTLSKIVEIHFEQFHFSQK